MQAPCLECLALLIAVDTYWMVPFRTTNNRTMQSIHRYRLEHQLVPDAHNNNAVASPRMSRLVDCCEYVVHDGTLSHNNIRTMQSIRRYRFEGRFVLDGHNDNEVALP
jgi:hypothetical protein